mmetsp:Transcript_45981/g.111980  ORF Transcript_45981/g.111980 Transcript_45981/m.111980 type:complete len:195 (+) Transcript_45981:53-637(+)|eukprot:CAMPEP_0206213220 /NCGR_PEP_ID=MMETSP0047_2-20121206/1005_1 /ASSEMBLY_ACC=CAM_ASM_000192 /TAXON_ID=195065 /ORGANISM="Chroomonas mesostigmatica_cf, Strain CCMP1168" /LENGTH=194 /DNA_ID=CAMNT_0053635353 /DNA_START=46 /DNA_END=630 /DNA_ORIENTATION=-
MSTLVMPHHAGLPQSGHSHEGLAQGLGFKAGSHYSHTPSDVVPSHPLSPGLSGHGPWGPPEEDAASLGSRGGSPQPPAYRAEALAAAGFWSDNLTRVVSREAASRFQAALARRIEHRCASAWYPENPTRGQGFRAVVNSASERRCDPILVEAAREAGIEQVGSALPTCVMWVDPGRVAAKPDSYDFTVQTQRIF